MQYFGHCLLPTRDKKRKLSKSPKFGLRFLQETACFIAQGTGMTCKLTYMSASIEFNRVFRVQWGNPVQGDRMGKSQPGESGSRSNLDLYQVACSLTA